MDGNSGNVKREDGAALLDEAYGFQGRFVAYPSVHARVAHCLWCGHTHIMPAWDSTPRLAFLSPEPGSGKTRALEVTELLVPNPVATVNATPAFLIRRIANQDELPTVLFDEADATFGPAAGGNEEIRALINAGHRRGAPAGRCVARGSIIECEELPSYAAVALAGLNDLPDTIMSRAIVVRMKKRAPEEQVEPFRQRVHGPIGKSLCARITAWAALVVGEAAEARPKMPDGVVDRSADVWEPLLVVADLAGGGWPERARAAAVAMVAAAQAAEPSLNIQLLTDLRIVFGSEDALSSKVIIDRLLALEGSPWSDIRGKSLDSNKLARRLRGYGVGPKTIRVGGSTPKGYARADLHDAWRRYLPSPSPEEAATAATGATTQSFQENFAATAENGAATAATGRDDVAARVAGVAPCCRSNGAGNANETNVVAGVAVVAASAGDGRRQGNGDDRTCRQCKGSVDGTERRYAIDGETVWLHRECESHYLDRWR
jgi:hypothetical protein